MDEKEVHHQQQSTSLLELLYLIKAKNREELSFAEWLEYASCWAAGVIAEYEAEQRVATPSPEAIQSVEGGDADEYQSYQ